MYGRKLVAYGEKLRGSKSWSFVNDTEWPHAGKEILTAYRARLAVEEDARAYQKRLDLEEQRSDMNTPEVRIRAWEKVHGLRLPLDSSHPILDVIVLGTRLTLAEVQAEQRARSVRRANLSALE